MMKIGEEEIFDIHAPLNQERKFNHEECGDKRQRLYVRRTEKGWLYQCFNCGIRGFKRFSSINFNSIRNRTQLEKLGSREIKREFEMPKQANFTREAKEWLDKYRITEEEQEKYGIYYTNEFWGRVVLPVYDVQDGMSRILGFQLRRLSSETKYPKYITRKKDKSSPLRFYSVPKDMGTTKERVVIVVEDILSAIKIGRQYQALSLLGSPKKLPEDVCDYLSQDSAFRPLNIAFWLDPDKYGGSLEYVKRYNSLYNEGQNVVAIYSDKDPKEHSDEEITSLLRRHFK